MRVCENGHYVGDAKAKACDVCQARVTSGHKTSLFLPDALYRAVQADAKTVGESMSAQIVRHIIRDRDRKRPRSKAKGA